MKRYVERDVSEVVQSIKRTADDLYERANRQRGRMGAYEEAMAIELLGEAADLLSWVRRHGVGARELA